MSTTTLQQFAVAPTNLASSHWAPIIDNGPEAGRKHLRRPRPTNSHWAALTGGQPEDEDQDEDSQLIREEESTDRRLRRARPTNAHWACLAEDEDTDEEGTGHRGPQTINSHWAVALEEDEDGTCRRRPPQALNSHWGSAIEADEDLDDDDEEVSANRWNSLVGGTAVDKFTKQATVDKPTGIKQAKAAKGDSEKAGKVKRYTRNKPALPSAFELKYRPPTNMASIVIPTCAQYALVRPARPGMAKRARKSGLVQVITSDEL